MREMKDSGIPWIGEIPKNWELIKGKYIFTQRNQKDNKINLELLSPTQNYGVIPQKKYEELSGMNSVKLKESTDLHLLKTIHKGDYCISLRSFQGGFEYSEYEGVVSPAYQVFYPITPIDRGYYKYLFKEKTFINKMNSYTMSMRDGKNIAFTDFGNTYIPFPPVQEQQCIADFLDTKCARIDFIKKNMEAEIEALKQYKQSVITEAVTKGLNKNVKMKDSGIPWIGKIPKDWKVCPLKYLCSYNNETLPENTNSEYEFDYVDIGSVTYGKGIENYQHLKFSKAPSRARRLVKKGDVILSTVRTYLKATAQIPENVYPIVVSTGYLTLRAKEQIIPNFLKYSVQQDAFISEIEAKSSGVSYPAINAIEAVRTNVIVPPIYEQQRIADYLDSKCSKIDSIIQKKQELLANLDTYKKSLIYEYVTGKKEVPSA